jgi:hypothetical protein
VLKAVCLMMILVLEINAKTFYPSFKVAILPNEPQDKGVVKEEGTKSIQYWRKSKYYMEQKRYKLL